jgi:hypothetical protein
MCGGVSECVCCCFKKVAGHGLADLFGTKGISRQVIINCSVNQCSASSRKKGLSLAA